MTRLIILCFLGLSLSNVHARAQVSLDSIQLRPVRGAAVSYSSVTKKDSLILLCFWSVNSEASINELNAINSQYAKWKKSASFHLLAICADAGNLLNRMRPTANQNNWTFDVYGDMNGDLQETFHVKDLPESLILWKGQVVYQQSGFSPGSENFLFDKIRNLAAGKS